MGRKAQHRTRHTVDNQHVRQSRRMIYREAGFLVKVGVAPAAKGQIADVGDLVAALGNDKNPGFASFLGAIGTEPAATSRISSNRDKQIVRTKVKTGNEDANTAQQMSKSGATSNPVSLPICPRIDAVLWQLGSNPEAAMDSETTIRNLTTVDTAGNVIAAGPPFQPVKVPIANQPKLQNESTFNEGMSEVAPAGGSNTIRYQNPNIAAIEPLRKPDQKSISLVATRSQSTDEVVAQPGTVFVDDSASSIRQEKVDRRPLEDLIAQGYTASTNNAVKSSVGEGASWTGSTEKTSNLPAQDGGDPGKSLAPSQPLVDPTSTGASGGQGNGAETHRGSSEAKGAMANNRALLPQVSNLGNSNPGISTHAHSAVVPSAHLESGHHVEPSTQIKDLTPPQFYDVNSARLLGSAMRGGLRIGVQTEAFGRVTIQTNAQGGQLSAQVSLENTKEGAALATHLPAVEQKIIQQHGLNASVRIVGGFDGGAGGGSAGRNQSESERRSPEQTERNVVAAPTKIQRTSSSEIRAIETPLLGRHSVSSRLDITV